MANQIQVPDFNFMPALFPELRAALRRRGRVNAPELTVEDDKDPFMQLEQAAALMGHDAAVLGDWLARHLFLPTSLYRPLVAAQLATIDERLAAASPATADIVAKLTRILTADLAALVPALSRFATVAAPGAPAISFESPATDIGASRTDRLLSAAFDASGGGGAGSYATPSVGADLWPSAAAAGDMLYIGHPDLMFDEAQIALGLAGSGISGCWEYFGGKETLPDAVGVVGPYLTFIINGLLGAARRSGAQVTITCLPTGQSVTFASTWGTQNVISTTEWFGQASPSTSVADYLCSVDWVELPGIGGGNDGLDSTGSSEVTWTLPQTLAHDWQPTTVDDVEGYWVRFRVVTVSGPVEPQLSADIGPGAADFFVRFLGTQGQTIDDTLGTSDGSASQAFPLNRTGFIESTLTALTVGTDDGWSVTEEPTDLYTAAPTEKVALLEMMPDGAYQVLFGDGTHGAIPPVGDAIVASYRIGSDSDGNVGAGAIARNVSGVGHLTDVNNPRAAAGWTVAEGGTAADLERVKRVKPAAMRTRGRAINDGDCVALAINDFYSSAGSRPVARAWCAVEAFGLKTFGLVVIGAGGGTLSAAVLLEINTFFNGTTENDPARHLLANYELTTANFNPLAVSGAVTVTVRRSSAGVEAAVKAILAANLRPLAVYEDGAYRWEPGRYGGRVAPNQIEAIIAEQLTIRRAVEVEVTDINGGGATAISLAADELPDYAGDASWTVTIVVLP